MHGVYGHAEALALPDQRAACAVPAETLASYFVISAGQPLLLDIFLLRAAGYPL